MRRFLIVVACVVSVPALLSAQGRGGGIGMGHAGASAAAPHAAMHAPAIGGHIAAPHAVPGHYVRSSSGAVVFRPSGFNTSAVRPNGGRRVLSQDVPGLGFDYPHLAAVGGSRGLGRFPRGDRRHRPFMAYFPFYGGGYYLPFDDYDQGYPADQEETEAEPDYYQGYPPPPRPGDTAQGLPAPAPAEEPWSPERPADEYVFVRRDGTFFFAVAYTWVDGNLRYVTGEGLKRSVSGDTLDLNATQQFNEQRGLVFRLPA